MATKAVNENDLNGINAKLVGKIVQVRPTVNLSNLTDEKTKVMVSNIQYVVFGCWCDGV